MSDAEFYASAMAGLPSLIARWLEIGDASPDRLGIILADTARIAKLGEPATDPDGATLARWATAAVEADRPPLWAVKATLFLLSQMPARPCPQDDAQRDGWAWAWLRLRRWESYEQARDALPSWLLEALGEHLQRAWRDRQRQRLL
ncbi:hypothetical protein [Kushneria aurantia]|uniref:Uncharacterized protein n=1 Tax=Kushneria aurantia TaxID=504092 RepID=A0ABV6G5X2_9GAMM|nr:hypothetical protein [Kushneria aurantia]